VEPRQCYDLADAKWPLKAILGSS